MTGSRNRRLFFCLWPDDETRSAIVHATRKVVRACGGRPVPPENLHMTLAFLGKASPDVFEALSQICIDVEAPGSIHIARFGYWPGPRVLWAGPEMPHPALDQLAGAIWSYAESLGLRRETRPLLPHVTLARKAQHLPAAIPPLEVVWPVRDFALVESVPGQRPVYRILARYDLESARKYRD